MITLPGFQIKDKIFEGFNSIIYRAFHQDQSKDVILKTLRNQYPSGEEIARFKQEYQITKSLNNIKGVINALDIVEHQNIFAIVLDDIAGDSLKRELDSVQLEVLHFLKLAIRLTEILSQIHSENIIHKDINPSNIVWNRESDQLMIIDFGISTSLSRENAEIRNPNRLEGSLAYMAPEQTGRMNRPIDHRSDLYSLGVTFYELLSGGKALFEASDPMELVHCHTILVVQEDFPRW